MEDHDEADTNTAAQIGPHTIASGCGLKETLAHAGPMQEQVVCQEMQPVGDPQWSSPFLKNGPHVMDPYRSSSSDQFEKESILWEVLEQGKNTRRKEQQKQSLMD